MYEEEQREQNVVLTLQNKEKGDCDGKIIRFNRQREQLEQKKGGWIREGKSEKELNEQRRH